MQTKGIRGICTVIGWAFGKSIVKLMYCNVAVCNQSAMNSRIGSASSAALIGRVVTTIYNADLISCEFPKSVKKSLAPATTFPHLIIAHNELGRVEGS